MQTEAGISAAGTDERQAWLSPQDYNFEHFRTRHLLMDVEGTLKVRGIQPGEVAPDFDLPVAGGNTIRLSDLRDRPVLLHFGSGT